MVNSRFCSDANELYIVPTVSACELCLLLSSAEPLLGVHLLGWYLAWPQCEDQSTYQPCADQDNSLQVHKYSTVQSSWL